MKYIISFTTSPLRIHKCEEVIKRLCQQTLKPDKILLNIPDIFLRTGESYTVPRFISNYPIMVNYCGEDLGPGTKIIPTVKYAINNKYDIYNTRIIYFDDDIKYPKKMVEYYDKYMISHVCGPCGFTPLNKDDTILYDKSDKIGIIEGFGGVCVSLEVFKDDFFEYCNYCIQDKDARLSDDVYLSNYYKKHNYSFQRMNVPIYSQSYIITNYILEYGLDSEALHIMDNENENLKRYKRVFEWFKSTDKFYLNL
jgi:hypothetical protein